MSFSKEVSFTLTILEGFFDHVGSFGLRTLLLVTIHAYVVTSFSTCYSVPIFYESYPYGPLTSTIY